MFKKSKQPHRNTFSSKKYKQGFVSTSFELTKPCLRFVASAKAGSAYANADRNVGAIILPIGHFGVRPNLKLPFYGRILVDLEAHRLRATCGG